MPNNHAHYVSFPVPLEQGPLESDYSSAGIQRPETFMEMNNQLFDELTLSDKADRQKENSPLEKMPGKEFSFERSRRHQTRQIT